MTAGKDHVSARERRVDERYAVRLDAVVRAYRMPTLAASLLDISAGGAMIEADAGAYQLGEEVTFSAAGSELVATIAWLNDQFIGLAFHRRLGTRELGRFRKAGQS